MSEECVVLITGCSSGIGRALVEEFASRKGTFVYASGRRLESVRDLCDNSSGNVDVVRIDVCDEDSIDAAVSHILREKGRIDILVNNAGMSYIGPSLDMPLDEQRRIFETNLFAVNAMIQRVAPSMMECRRGTIVNIGSVVGVFPTPFAGAYCATKAALHAWSDVWRTELSPFGLNVVIIAPGGIKTDIVEKQTRSAWADSDYYGPIADYVLKRATASQSNPTPADDFARKVVSQVMRITPPPFYHYGHNSTLLVWAAWLLPRWISDWILNRKFGLNRLASLLRTQGT